MLALCVALATLWIPIKTDKQFQPLVESEMTQLENTLEQLEALTVEEDASIEEWREQISALNQEDKVSSILRQSDYLQDQMNQRQAEMMDAIQEGMEALESGEAQSMTQAMNSLQDQGLIPKSAKDEQALASQAMEFSTGTISRWRTRFNILKRTRQSTAKWSVTKWSAAKWSTNRDSKSIE